jgi:hypothetical protein
MPTCKICKLNFPNIIKVDGKEKNVKNRKYCIICSPFGIHNTKQLHLQSPVNIGKKLCPRCHIEKLANCFYMRRDGKDFSVYCKKCSCEEVIERQRKMKHKCVIYKGGSCEICGYNKCDSALEFHHLDPSKKDFSISNMKKTTYNKKIELELDKCRLLCANCHREEHIKWCRYSELN